MRPLLLGTALLATLGCSSEGASIFDGPSTACFYTSTTADQAIGAACTTNEDCQGAICMNPTDGGNITNNVFSFCTRSCNCNDDQSLTIESSDNALSCVYPGGCNPGAGDSRFRYATLKCQSLSDCQAVDSRYTHCVPTDQLTTKSASCGQLHKVCLAIQ